LSVVAGKLLARATRVLSTHPNAYYLDEGNYSAEIIGTTYTVKFTDAMQVANRLRIIRAKMMSTLRVPILTISADIGSGTAIVSVVPRPFVKNNPTPAMVQAAFDEAMS
jgi:hypothetical protein